jgi:hypothetical protein
MIRWLQEYQLRRLENRLIDVAMADTYDVKSQIYADVIKADIKALRKKLGYDNWKA